MVAPELRSRARRYGYIGKTKEQMLADLHKDGLPDTLVQLSREWERAVAKIEKKDD